MKRRLLSLVTGIAVALGALTGCAQSVAPSAPATGGAPADGAEASDKIYRTLDEIKESGTVNIGVFSDKNPFGYIDENGYLRLGDRLKDLAIQVQVTWADGTSAIMDTGWEPVPSGALTKDDKSFYVTFQNVKSESRNIKVVDKNSEGGGGGSGGGGGGGSTTTDDELRAVLETLLTGGLL